MDLLALTLVLTLSLLWGPPAVMGVCVDDETAFFDGECRTSFRFAPDHILPPDWGLLLDSYDFSGLVGTTTVQQWRILDVDGISTSSPQGIWSENGGTCQHGLRICSIMLPSQNQQNNWIFSDYIRFPSVSNVDDVQEVFFNMSFRFTQCVTPCVNSYATLYRYDVNAPVSADQRVAPSNYQLLGGIADSRLNQATSPTNNANSVWSIPRPATNGFYLAFRDEGNCGNINRVYVYYRRSPGYTGTFLTCPSVPFPIQGSTGTTRGTCCCGVNTENKTSLDRICSADGSCVEPATDVCGCSPGYVFMNGVCQVVTCPVLTAPTNGALFTSSLDYQGISAYICDTGFVIAGDPVRTCQATGEWSGEAPTCQPASSTRCPVGTYIRGLSTGVSVCVPCPGNSFSPVINSTECSCFRGYYRTEMEEPNFRCSSPPNTCKSLQIDTERTRGNTITVRWERPEITGRDDFYYNIFYSEDNQTFTQHNSRPYVKQDALVDYSVSGLQPLTTYTIRVIPENGVSDQEEGGQSRSCEIVARTGDTRSNAPEVVIGFCSVVVWTTPTRSYGRITGYDVRFIPQTSGSDMMVSKGRKELFHAVGGLVSTDNVMVQVRAKTSAAEGKWSELVPLGCRNAGGFAGPIYE